MTSHRLQDLGIARYLTADIAGRGEDGVFAYDGSEMIQQPSA